MVVFQFLHFASLVGVPVCIASFGICLKICAITTEIKKYKTIVKKKMKKHDKIVFLEVLTSKALIESYINHDDFFQ